MLGRELSASEFDKGAAAAKVAFEIPGFLLDELIDKLDNLFSRALAEGFRIR